MTRPFELVEGDESLACADGVCALPSAQPADSSEDSARA